MNRHMIVTAELDNCPDNPPWVDEWLDQLADLLELGGVASKAEAVLTDAGILAAVMCNHGHIVVLFLEEVGRMQMDIYSQGYISKTYIAVQLECLEPTRIEHKFIDRESGMVRLW